MPRFRPRPQPADPPPVHRPVRGFFDLSDEEQFEWAESLLQSLNPNRRPTAPDPTVTGVDGGRRRWWRRAWPRHEARGR
ncbi:MAG: hypothetical protein ACKOVH_01215 [Actinomycetota bacterium]